MFFVQKTSIVWFSFLQKFSLCLCTVQLFPQGWSSQGMKLTTHLYLIPTLRMHGALPLLPHMSSWCGSYLSKGYVFMAWYLVKNRDNFTLPYLSMKTLIHLSVSKWWISIPMQVEKDLSNRIWGKLSHC